jgi:PKD repeat protein
MTRTGTAAVVLAAFAAWGCSDIKVSGPQPLSFTLSADPMSAPTGVEIEFHFEATGTYLNGVILEYGDGKSDSIPMNGAQSASGRRKHAYDVAGDYTVIGTLEDAAEGPLTRQVQVSITAPVAYAR